jgi:hypothetical protein
MYYIYLGFRVYMYVHRVLGFRVYIYIHTHTYIRHKRRQRRRRRRRRPRRRRSLGRKPPKRFPSIV